jgi:diguanylate cyclase (GGDEF)-like protein
MPNKLSPPPRDLRGFLTRMHEMVMGLRLIGPLTQKLPPADEREKFSFDEAKTVLDACNIEVPQERFFTPTTQNALRELAFEVVVAYEAMDAQALENAKLREENLNLAAEAATDFLTGAGSRREFERSLERTIAAIKTDSVLPGRNRRTKPRNKPIDPYSVVFLDIKKFSDINDIYGHTSGDQVLKLVAQTLKTNASGGSLVARNSSGSDEFFVILHNCTEEQARGYVSRVRNALQQATIKVKDRDVTLNIDFREKIHQLTEHDTVQSVLEKIDVKGELFATPSPPVTHPPSEIFQSNVTHAQAALQEPPVITTFPVIPDGTGSSFIVGSRIPSLPSHLQPSKSHARIAGSGENDGLETPPLP